MLVAVACGRWAAIAGTAVLNPPELVVAAEIVIT
jgi:hypothetical protein